MPHNKCNTFSRPDGFTLIELVVVMIIIGILAVVAIPRLNDTGFSERGFRDGVYAVIAHARHTAIASRRYTCVTVVPGTGSAATVSVTRDVTDPDSIVSINCSVAVPLPAKASGCTLNNQVCAPSNVSLGGTANLYFDPRGRLVQQGSPRVIAASAASITISNQTAITVVPETGYTQ